MLRSGEVLGLPVSSIWTASTVWSCLQGLNWTCDGYCQFLSRPKPHWRGELFVGKASFSQICTLWWALWPLSPTPRPLTPLRTCGSQQETRGFRLGQLGLRGSSALLQGPAPEWRWGSGPEAEQEVELQEAGPLSLIEQGSPRCCQQPLGTMKGVSLKSAALLMAEQSVSGNWGCW